MATNLKLVRAISIQGIYEGSADLESAVSRIRQVWSHQYVDGTDPGEANTIWADTLSLNGQSSLDLTGGLTDRWGTALTFTKMCDILIANRAPNSNIIGLSVSGNFTGAMFGNSIAVRSGGIVCMSSPYQPVTVTNASTDTITFDTDDDEAYDVDVILIGIR